MTVLPHLPHLDPAQTMTRRARWYLIILTVQHLAIGACVLGLPWLFHAAAFVPLVQYTRLVAWGVGFVVVGSVCCAGAITRRLSVARFGLGASSVITLLCAFAIGWGVVQTWIAAAQGTGQPASPFVVIFLAAAMAKDFLMVRLPLRTPFEDLAEDFDLDHLLDEMRGQEKSGGDP